jgi:SAM-dependent methyltransferase
MILDTLIERSRRAVWLLPRLRRSVLRSAGPYRRGLCHACGAHVAFEYREVLWPTLVNEWRLTPAMKAAFDRRESGTCPTCHNNYRNRQLARAIVELFRKHSEASLTELTRSAHFRSLKILGIDLDALSMLERCPGFSRSRYITSLIPARGLSDEGLSFADRSIDLVLVSDTLEHVPSHPRVLQEISRVLKPGGIFATVQPVILSRRTVTRCVVDQAGLVRHLLAPSYHARQPDDSLVFVEFGIDFLDDLARADLRPSLYFYDSLADDYAWVAVCTKGA